MNVADERSKSYWMKDAPVIEASPLKSDAECDVVVIGSGIAGLSTAYELTRFSRTVIVIDRARIGGGMTARTTAHLATELDDFYSELTRIRGEDEARLYYDSQVAAVNRIEAICRDEEIDADFARVDGFLFPAEEGHRADLEEEYHACVKIGVDVEWVDNAPIPGIRTGKALRFPGQGRLHPTKYLAGLAHAVLAGGGRVYSNTAYVSHNETDGHVEITTDEGHTIRAGAAVFATNSPVNDKVAIHTKQIPNRTYAIAGRVPKGSVPDALVWDTYDPYHYVRIQPLGTGDDLLIVGGEDHRSGEASGMDKRLANLEQWARKGYPSLGKVEFRWSGQIMEPVDFMPYSGRNPGNRNIYVHTGDSGQGITNGVAGSLIILPLILGEDSRYAPLLEPSRKSFSSTALGEFIQGQAEVVKNMAEHIGPSEVSSVEEITPGEGAIMRQGALKIACYKSEGGKFTRVSAICSHIGCIVHWNTFEKCWDCPCHGSQFSPSGDVLNGPAVTRLAKVE